jgi:hypothetical protein
MKLAPDMKGLEARLCWWCSQSRHGDGAGSCNHEALADGGNAQGPGEILLIGEVRELEPKVP